MRKLRIGYSPLSFNLKSAGDRRRIIFWSEARGHTIITDLNQKVDVLVASENSDFNSNYFHRSKVPVVLDLVDAYLSPLNPIEDLARGLAKSISRQISGEVKSFSHHVRDFCEQANAVLCSSIEQEAVIKPYNTNTHVILDSHDEISFVDRSVAAIEFGKKKKILWEGQPATIRGVRQIASAFSKLASVHQFELDFVTDEEYFLILNKYIARSTLSLLKKDLNQFSDAITITPWTQNNLVVAANKSTVAMIPIDLSVPMQRLKPENRLLIMWRLGLPCLTSPSPAYIRVSQLAGVDAICDSPQAWYENFNYLLNDPIFAKNEVLKGQNYLREKHTREILLSKWDMAIESVLQ